MLKTLTTWQPWASLIMAGLKPYEFRTWPAPRRLHGTRIAIHAGARPVRVDEINDLRVRLAGRHPWTTCLKPEALALLDRWALSPESLPRSCVLGTVMLGEPVRARDIVSEFGGNMDSLGDEFSNWAWPMSDIEHFEPPQPASGAQGLWDWRPPQ